jgi:hypothetical protein
MHAQHAALAPVPARCCRGVAGPGGFLILLFIHQNDFS